MPRTLTTEQDVLVDNPTLHRVSVVKITTFSDYTTQEVANNYYFATQHLYFQMDGEVREFLPLLRVHGDIVADMNHLPDPHAQDGSVAKSILIELENRVVDLEDGTSTNLLNLFKRDPIPFSQIQIGHILYDPTRTDIADLQDTDEQVTWFRGEVVQMEEATLEKIVLRFESQDFPLPWIVCDLEDQNDPLDLGKKIPVSLGVNKKVPCIGWDVGGVTTLAEKLEAGATTVILTDGSRFPESGSGHLQGEEITWTGKNADSTALTGVTRGVGTDDVEHAAGEILVELPASVDFIAAGNEQDALDNLYVISPHNQQLVRVTTPYTVETRDTTLISDETVCSINFTQAELRELLEDLAEQARVTVNTEVTTQPVVNQQPAFTSTTTSGKQYGIDTSYGGGGAAAEGARVIDGFPEFPDIPDPVPVPSTEAAHITTDATNGNGIRGIGAKFPSVSGDIEQDILHFWLASMGGGAGDVLEVYKSASGGTGTKIGEIPSGTGGGWRTVVATVGEDGQSALNHQWWHIRCTRGGGNPHFSAHIAEMRREVIFAEPTTRTTDAATASAVVQEVEIAAASLGGSGLRFYADLTGPQTTGEYNGHDAFPSEVTGPIVTDACVEADDSFVQMQTESRTGGVGSPLTWGEDEWSVSCWFKPASVLPWTGLSLGVFDYVSEFGGTTVSNINRKQIRFIRHGILGSNDWSFEVLLWDKNNTDSTDWRYRRTNAEGGFEAVASNGLNEWNFVTVTYDPTESGVHNRVKVYMNGAQLTPNQTPLNDVDIETDLSTSSGSYMVLGGQAPVKGSNPDFPTDTMRGCFHRLGCWNTVLTEDEHQLLYNGGKGNRVDWLVNQGAYTSQADLQHYYELGHDISDTGEGQEPADNPEFTQMHDTGHAADTGAEWHLNDRQAYFASPPFNGFYRFPLIHNTGAGPNRLLGGLATTISRPEDLIRWTIAEFAGLGHDAIDETTFLAMADNTLFADRAVILNDMGETFRLCLAALGFEGRCNVVLEEDADRSRYRILSSNWDYTYGDTDIDGDSGELIPEVSEWLEFREIGRNTNAGQVSTRFSALFDIDYSLQVQTRELDVYKGHVQANLDDSDLIQPLTSDFAAAETQFGRRDHPALKFLSVRDRDAAQELLGFYAHELLRDGPTYEIDGVPWTQAYKLERGDLIRFTPPWEDEEKIARIVGYVRRFDDEMANLVAVNVDFGTTSLPEPIEAHIVPDNANFVIETDGQVDVGIEDKFTLMYRFERQSGISEPNEDTWIEILTGTDNNNLIRVFNDDSTAGDGVRYLECVANANDFDTTGDRQAYRFNAPHISFGIWDVMVVTYDSARTTGNRFKFYKPQTGHTSATALQLGGGNTGNGTGVAQDDDTITLENTARAIRISGGQKKYQFAIWDRVLTDDEILFMGRNIGWDLNSDSPEDWTGLGEYTASDALQHWYRFGADQFNIGRDYSDVAEDANNDADMNQITLGSGTDYTDESELISTFGNPQTSVDGDPNTGAGG